MLNDTDRQLVMAYVDGELSDGERRVVERRLEAEPEARTLEREFRESRDLLLRAFTAEAEEPVPERLLDLFAERQTNGAEKDSAEVIDLAAFLRKPAFGPARRYTALAASVLLSVGLGLGTLLSPSFGPDTGAPHLSAEIAAVSDPAIRRLLESTPSGEAVAWKSARTGTSGQFAPLSTFRDRAGRICRQFIQSVSGDGGERRVSAISCQAGSGAWSTAHMTVEPPSPSGETEAYAPASGAADDVLSKAMEAMIDGAPLDPAAEDRLLKDLSRE